MPKAYPTQDSEVLAFLTEQYIAIEAFKDGVYDAKDEAGGDTEKRLEDHIELLVTIRDDIQRSITRLLRETVAPNEVDSTTRAVILKDRILLHLFEETEGIDGALIVVPTTQVLNLAAARGPERS